MPLISRELLIVVLSFFYKNTDFIFLIRTNFLLFCLILILFANLLMTVTLFRHIKDPTAKVVLLSKIDYFISSSAAFVTETATLDLHSCNTSSHVPIINETALLFPASADNSTKHKGLNSRKNRNTSGKRRTSNYTMST
jgi:hypothetical protein